MQCKQLNWVEVLESCIIHKCGVVSVCMPAVIGVAPKYKPIPSILFGYLFVCIGTFRHFLQFVFLIQNGLCFSIFFSLSSYLEKVLIKV